MLAGLSSPQITEWNLWIDHFPSPLEKATARICATVHNAMTGADASEADFLPMRCLRPAEEAPVGAITAAFKRFAAANQERFHASH